MVSINSNSAALFAQRNLNLSSTESENSIARLSSGQRIIAAKDDVAGLSVGTILSTTISTLKTAQTSTSQAQSMLAIADGGLKNVGDILQRQKALAVQANTGSLSDNERGFLNQEFQNLTSEIDRIVTNTNLNGVNLIDGSLRKTSDLEVADATLVEAKGDLGSLALASNSTFTVGGTGFDQDLIGSMSNAKVDVKYNSATDVAIHLTVNNERYSTTVAYDISAGGSVTLTSDSEGAASTISFNLEAATVGSQTVADTLARNIESDISGITVYQTRTASDSVPDNGLPAAKFDNTILKGLDNTDFTFISSKFDTTEGKAPSIEGFRVTAEDANAGTDGKIEVTIDGVVFETGLGIFDDNGADLKTEGAVVLTSKDDNNETLTINFTDLSTTLGIDTKDEASSLEDALNTLFSVGAKGGADFQVGTVSSDKISVSIEDSSTKAIYKNNEGSIENLDISTSTGAIVASEVLDNAINTITSLRADVGALQSRFEFASSNLASSIQNSSAARSDFLDVDVAAESTNFAASQVRLQASVSVLAQANQLPQNLLKLIG
jgi:flagellin